MSRPAPDRAWLTTECANCGKGDAHHHFGGMCYPGIFALVAAAHVALVVFCVVMALGWWFA